MVGVGSGKALVVMRSAKSLLTATEANALLTKTVMWHMMLQMMFSDSDVAEVGVFRQ